VIGQRRSETGKDFLEVKSTYVGPNDQQANNEARITHTINNKCFIGGVGSGLAFIVETDEKIRADTDQLPADEYLEQVVGQNQIEHGEAEERKVHEEPAKTAASLQMPPGRMNLVVFDGFLQFLPHVADGKEMD